MLNNVIRLIRTLAAQLAISKPTARNALQKLKDDNFNDSDSVPSMLQQLMRNSLTDTVQNVFIVLDGLDECDNNTAKDKDSAIKKLIEGPLALDVKLLISSRPSPEISHNLESVTKRAFTSNDSKEDIRSYVTMHVSKFRVLQKGFKSLAKDPSEFIAEKSQGNFQWVKIALDILKKKASVKDFEEVINTTPKDLERVYDQLLTNLKIAGTLDMALAILKSVLFSDRLLTLEEIKVAVGLLHEEILALTDFVESNCGSFLQVLLGCKGLYISHETFRSYITNPTSSGGICLLSATSYAQLATTCFDCILDLENHELDTFYHYAVPRWLDHLDSLLTASDEAAGKDILYLLVKSTTFSASLTTCMRDSGNI